MSLLNLIDHLPSASFLAEAQADDEELAAAYLRQNPDLKARAPRVSEWTPERAELTNLADRIGELITVTLLAAGGKPGFPQPRPRPETAVDRMQHRVRQAQHQALVERLIRNRRRAP